MPEEVTTRVREYMFKQLAEAADEVFWIRDVSQDRLLYVSPAYQQIWGVSPDMIYRDPRLFLDSMHPDDRPRAEQILQQLFARGNQQTNYRADVEYRVVRPDGQIRWVRVRGFPI